MPTSYFGAENIRNSNLTNVQMNLANSKGEGGQKGDLNDKIKEAAKKGKATPYAWFCLFLIVIMRIAHQNQQ